MMYCSTGKSMVKEIQCKSLGNFYNILSSLISLFFGFYIAGPQVSCRWVKYNAWRRYDVHMNQLK